MALWGHLIFCSMKKLILFCLFSLSAFAQEKHRPTMHFTPPSMWMNDPNGMFFLNGTYHLYYQYYPKSTVWGPMHWGHATSTDLIAWTHQPIALYPDSLGLIFSGSAVVDRNNTAGFGKNAVVAVFTHHNMDWEKAGRVDRENQSIAYSLDEGQTFTKFTGNPVIKNPGIPNFRDPNVAWNAAANQWVMTLATEDRVTFYASADLKNWTRESDFGANLGSHAGVWECPDLFPTTVDGVKKWVLLVSMNPGAPNGGSGTQYFVGDFDGKTFTSQDTQTRWIDWGRDNYAGVTFHETESKRIFMGWMSNWDYATVVPTGSWRSATTIARDLSLVRINGAYTIASNPVAELQKYVTSTKAIKTGSIIKSSTVGMLTGELKSLADFHIELSNAKGESVTIGYEKAGNRFFVDRTKSGKMDFSNRFTGKIYAPRISTSPTMDFRLLTDVASLEFFADKGLSTITEIYFPSEPFTQWRVKSVSGMDLKLSVLKPAL